MRQFQCCGWGEREYHNSNTFDYAIIALRFLSGWFSNFQFNLQSDSMQLYNRRDFLDISTDIFNRLCIYGYSRVIYIQSLDSRLMKFRKSILVSNARKSEQRLNWNLILTLMWVDGRLPWHWCSAEDCYYSDCIGEINSIIDHLLLPISYRDP